MLDANRQGGVAIHFGTGQIRDPFAKQFRQVLVVLPLLVYGFAFTERLSGSRLEVYNERGYREDTPMRDPLPVKLFIPVSYRHEMDNRSLPNSSVHGSRGTVCFSNLWLGFS